MASHYLSASAPSSPMSSVSGMDLDRPDLDDVHDLLHVMRTTLSSMNSAFDALGQQTARVSKLAPAIEANYQISRFRDALAKQEKRQRAGVLEMHSLISDTLAAQVADHMGAAVAQMVREGIARRVQAGVERELANLPPTSSIATVRQQLDTHKKQLADVRRGLANAEARRCNALLRSTHLHEPLSPLLLPGQDAPHPQFPATLSQLFGITTATARVLIRAYGIDEGDDAGGDDPLSPTSAGGNNGALVRRKSKPGEREKNLNKFMTFIGVAFQMVPAPAAGTTTNGAGAPVPLIAQAITN